MKTAAERDTVTITQYAALVGVLVDLVQRAPGLELWALHPATIDGRLSLEVLAATRAGVAAWGDLLGEHDEHVAASGRLHCQASGTVCGVAVRAVAIVDVPADVASPSVLHDMISA